ncbi:MAG: TIGR00725 family protein [Solirubrobacterales bacterium]
MSRRNQIAVIGPRRATDEELALAREVGARLADAGAVVVCGGLGGVMEAVAGAARDRGADVIGILPGADPDDANPHCTHVVAATTGIARNLAVVASADAVVAIGGAWGTLSEIAHARQLGRPVIALKSWQLTPASEVEGGTGIILASTAAEAVKRALAYAPAAR